MSKSPKAPTLPEEEETKPRTEQSEHSCSLIRNQVINSLGRPGDLYRVNVLPLWGRHYRVNVLNGADAVTARIVNSFFVLADEAGKIVRSTPAITKQY
ncbi:hypothetical protein [Fimbriiglobus ruber]|uniref:Uncharacterized protein n=1 Tax=Fimbriiglobus ruber TaxID=1908690 RepID=A0A225E0B0_9BACT|nr:hypothetical protein [Fimbriiglobus ruber]OWK42919.1 hypothetical protein FRUB_02516 [Fimbriiglobus ruber]